MNRIFAALQASSPPMNLAGLRFGSAAYFPLKPSAPANQDSSRVTREGRWACAAAQPYQILGRADLPVRRRPILVHPPS
jgi:hypothetical protein